MTNRRERISETLAQTAYYTDKVKQGELLWQIKDR